MTTLLCALPVISPCPGEPLSWFLTPETAFLFLTFRWTHTVHVLFCWPSLSPHLICGSPLDISCAESPAVEYASICPLSS